MLILWMSLSSEDVSELFARRPLRMFTGTSTERCLQLFGDRANQERTPTGGQVILHLFGKSNPRHSIESMIPHMTMPFTGHRISIKLDSDDLSTLLFWELTRTRARLLFSVPPSRSLALHCLRLAPEPCPRDMHM